MPEHFPQYSCWYVIAISAWSQYSVTYRLTTRTMWASFPQPLWQVQIKVIFTPVGSLSSYISMKVNIFSLKCICKTRTVNTFCSSANLLPPNLSINVRFPSSYLALGRGANESKSAERQKQELQEHREPLTSFSILLFSSISPYSNNALSSNKILLWVSNSNMNELFGLSLTSLLRTQTLFWTVSLVTSACRTFNACYKQIVTIRNN